MQAAHTARIFSRIPPPSLRRPSVRNSSACSTAASHLLWVYPSCHATVLGTCKIQAHPSLQPAVLHATCRCKTQGYPSLQTCCFVCDLQVQHPSMPQLATCCASSWSTCCLAPAGRAGQVLEHLWRMRSQISLQLWSSFQKRISLRLTRHRHLLPLGPPHVSTGPVC